MSMLPFDTHRRLFAAADDFRAPAVFNSWAMAARQAASPSAKVPAPAAHDGLWTEAEAVALANVAGFIGTSWTMGPAEMAYLLNLLRVPDAKAAALDVLQDWSFARGTDGRIVVATPIHGPGITPVWPARSGGKLAERVLYALADALMKAGCA